MKNKDVHFQHWGNIDYYEAWEKQKSIFETIASIKLKNREAKTITPTENYLIFCYHPHVYTLGRNGNQNNLLIDEHKLKQLDAKFYKIDRGGDITYHGPGQIVGYFIFDLENFATDINIFLRNIENSLINTLKDYALDVGIIKGLTGVWVDVEDQRLSRKIASIGIKTGRWISMHGFALNIDVDLKYFNQIVPCGISDKKSTSLNKETNKKIDFTELEQKLRNNIADIFEINYTTPTK